MLIATKGCFSSTGSKESTHLPPQKKKKKKKKNPAYQKVKDQTMTARKTVL